jgi:phage terminase large subunit GpA-like protein
MTGLFSALVEVQYGHEGWVLRFDEGTPIPNGLAKALLQTATAAFAVRHIYAIKGMDGAADLAAARRQEQEASREQRLDDRRRHRQGRHLFEAQSDDARPGLLPFPDRLPQEFFNQLTSEKVRTCFVRGHPVRYWSKPSGRRNEALDRRVYARAALHARPVPWEVLPCAAPTEPPPRPPSPPEGGGPPAPPPSSSSSPASRFERRRIRFRMR